MSGAVLIVDMINEFVSGRFGSARARRVVPRVAELASAAREKGIPVLFARDAHHPSDPELKVWGRHAMAGTHASEIVEGLRPLKGEKVFAKRQYTAFLNTGLDRTLRRLGTDTLFVAGISTDICVQANVADAFYRGYRTVVVSDCVESIDARSKAAALGYMERMFGSRIVELDKVKF